MTSPNDDLEFIKRYALTCTYLRGRLSVPKINMPSDRVATERSDDVRVEEVRLLPDMPDISDGHEHEYLGPHDPLWVVSTLCRYSVGHLRWEPRNPSRLHAAIPRPGGGPFCTRLRLSVPDSDGGARQWSYEPQSHALCSLRDDGSAAVSVQLAIYSDPGRIVLGYGDLSLTLALLEAGHCVGQLQMLLAAMRLPAQWRSGPTQFSEYSSSGQLLVGSFSFDLEHLAAKLDRLPIAQALVGWSNPPADYARRYPMVERAARVLDVAEASVSQKSLESSGSVARILAASRRRSSGLQGDGFVPKRALDELGLHDLLLLWRALHAPLRHDTEHPLRFHLAITGVDQMHSQIVEFDLLSGTFGESREIDAAAILRPHIGLGAGYNFDEFSFTLLMTCPLLNRIADEGPVGYRSTLVDAGAAGQSLLLALAEYNMFGRPFRAISEAALERKFGLPDSVVYAILCGRDRIINPTFSMYAA